MATKLRVIYSDGSEVEILASARAQIETERKFKTTAQAELQQIESSFYLAWWSLRSAGKDPGDFEAWVDTVADAEIVRAKTVEDEQATDPTLPAPGSTGSSD